MMKIRKTCPVCEAGELRPHTYSRELTHKSRRVRVDGLECMQCLSCGADPVSAEQSRRNFVRTADAKRSVDGLLSSAQIRAIREQLGLTQAQASQMFGGGPMAFSKYERGANIQSIAMDRLMRLVREEPALASRLAGHAGMESWRPVSG